MFKSFKFKFLFPVFLFLLFSSLWAENALYLQDQKLGNDAFNKKDYDLAISYYLKVTKENTDYFPAYEELGTCYYLKGDFKLARDAFGEAVLLDPKNEKLKAIVEKIDISLKDQKVSSEVTNAPFPSYFDSSQKADFDIFVNGSNYIVDQNNSYTGSFGFGGAAGIYYIADEHWLIGIKGILSIYSASTTKINYNGIFPSPSTQNTSIAELDFLLAAKYIFNNAKGRQFFGMSGLGYSFSSVNGPMVYLGVGESIDVNEKLKFTIEPGAGLIFDPNSQLNGEIFLNIGLSAN